MFSHQPLGWLVVDDENDFGPLFLCCVTFDRQHQLFQELIQPRVGNIREIGGFATYCFRLCFRKRKELGIDKARESVLMDMADRQALEG